MNLFSIKMRASKKKNGRSVHISGAEKISDIKNLDFYSKTMIKRALNHKNGSVDFINLKIEEIKTKNILTLNALPVSKIDVKSVKNGYEALEKLLKENNIKNPKKVLEFLKMTSSMRGAMLLDINSFKKMEKDSSRGIRATYMDTDKLCLEGKKNHFKEALILATKVANAPHIIGEICVSDDIDYQIGYFASKKSGYVRITKLKEKGDTFGGRIFLYNGKTESDLEETVDFIENKPVIVTGVDDVDTKDKYEFIKNSIKVLKEKGLYRDEIIADDSKIMFSSNNYLGFNNIDEIKKYTKQHIEKFGTGTGASRLVSGTTSLHKMLEKKIAKFKGQEDAIVFNSGYCANVGALSSLFKEGDVIFSDELNHASIIDGCRLSSAKTIIYKHNDMNDLENKIKSVSYKNGVIVSDAVFSMKGDICNLPKILELSEKYNLFSYIDEAHSTGVIGKNGHGVVEHFKLKKNPDILMGTLSKAIGSVGGYVTGKKILIDYLRNTSRSYIFSTSLPSCAISSSIKAFEILECDHSYVQKLQKNVKFFNSELKRMGIKARSKTPIFFITIGDEKRATEMSQALMDKGFFVRAIRYPTVQKGQAGLRITLSAIHSEENIKNLVQELAKVIK